MNLENGYGASPRLTNRMCSEHLITSGIGRKSKIQNEVDMQPSAGRGRFNNRNGVS
jgi:hypothetical protein